MIAEEWEQDRIKSLFKKGKRDNCSNYRDISLLNSGYKIYAKINTQRFKTISQALLLEEQNGFRTGRSRTDNVFTINPLNVELNPIRHLLALVGARHIVHVSRISVKQIIENIREFNL